MAPAQSLLVGLFVSLLRLSLFSKFPLFAKVQKNKYSRAMQKNER
ncbi:hypothetical protein HMPREF0971_00903 [Segatella oris F0302]|uniref:Uncharacterized protein n=1 Tax=Segatella oris F0302 TaxID=649760 RepID=D1QPL2_9BACT|nr:hypothetical protein HMPREF0971_00903 [Segatella oris F0302]